MRVDQTLLDLLVCPRCHSAISEVSDGAELACAGNECGLIFPVRDGIPVMLIDEARTATGDDDGRG